ncbi:MULTISPECIES: FAD-dependent oxidoreductase [Rhodopseudomonas]|uniref:FAD-dependent oxidoreductase n=1 Tax=Rhodopseudomonas palustris TaxID=1076 RepID=A0A0D7EKD8_RHOPL|nr:MULTISPECIES: FAD-dependent oxidoreductase [Rhodopseudomonas]KIZ41005.1 FAD-dependent oxidoreductase [Rhodopseudomonas palustris]MDF3809686.1 FAD-dependent oxidoreductase [Rhodopseudomonas sp. BAL398]WOK17412.1 FAD-dependent oxidoreductase [Rhodopseudomonas sp. BAL398]
MARFDAVVIGAGLGGLTAGAILAREGRKVVVIERSNSVGGAASSYKAGDLFVESSLHLTSDPHHGDDPKHAPLTRAGVLDAVKWIPAGALYQARGGPLTQPFVLPANFASARSALIERFPQARDGIEQALDEMQRIAATETALTDQDLSLSDRFDQLFGDNEAVKCALAANLSYYHDDPKTLRWASFAAAQGIFLRGGACFIQGGSQRLSSALARAIRKAGGEVLLRRTVSAIALNADGEARHITHTARDGSDPQTIEGARIIGNAAPETLATLLPEADATRLTDSYAQLTPSISLFALTLGLSTQPRSFGIDSYATQLLPDWMTTLADYAQGKSLMAEEPGGRMPPLAIVDYAAIDSGVPAPPYVLSVVGPDRLSNWSELAPEAYRAKRARWQQAIVDYLDAQYPGLAAAVTASSFNTALSVQQYLNAPQGAVYGFAPIVPKPNGPQPSRSPRTVLPGLYLASAYAGLGGYTGVVQSAAVCADMMLRDA